MGDFFGIVDFEIPYKPKGTWGFITWIGFKIYFHIHTNVKWMSTILTSNLLAFQSNPSSIIIFIIFFSAIAGEEVILLLHEGEEVVHQL